MNVMILKCSYSIPHRESTAIDLAAMGKHKIFQDISKELEKYVQLEKEERDITYPETIYSTELVVLAKEHWQYVKSMLKVLHDSLPTNVEARNAIREVVHEIEFK